MMTKEEYKKTLIRIWDGMRGGFSKGKPNCNSIRCIDCPMSKVCADGPLGVYDVIEFVENWAKEHPIETNGSVFLKNHPNAEVYKYEYDRTYDNEEDGYNHSFVYVKLDNSKPFVDGENGTKFPIRWWESEVDNANSD